MDTKVSILGNATCDEYVDTLSVARNGGEISITFRSGETMCFKVGADVSKISLNKIPKQFRRSPRKTRAGGGGLNSRLTIADIAELLSVEDQTFYLDFGRSEPFLESQIPGSKSWLNQWAAPHNYVFGGEAERYIFRMPLPSARGLGPAEYESIDRF